MTALILSLLLAAESDVPPAAPAVEAVPAATKKWSMDDCVREALKESGTLIEAQGKVKEWEGKLLEVQSVFWPKLQGITYVAPLYGLKNDPNTNALVTDWAKWGPYVKFQAILAQPIFTFGRAAAGEKAAANRTDVERARYQQARNFVALEVRRYYLLYLYAKSMMPALNQAKSILDEAEESAKTSYAESSGNVTQVDLQKLRYGATELAKFQVQARIGSELALAALKHTMGWGQSRPLELVDEVLPDLPGEPLPTLEQLIAAAMQNRPEVAQLKFGEAAAKAFAESEKLSVMPTAFVGGQLDLNWAPHWPSAPDAFSWDRFNSITPGIAIGLQFDLDPRKSWAKYQGALGLVEQVEGLKKFASTGIPVEVRKGYDDTVQADELTKLSANGSAAAKKWLVFAGTGYVAGTGEAKDVLEGLVTYLTARQGYFSNLQAAHFARANLKYVTGETGVDNQAAK